MTKVVLLSHLECNKLVKIPAEKEDSDVVYLRKEFAKEFQLEDQVSITIKRLDAEWKEFIDLADDMKM